jgi:hypothetical protein
MTRQTAAAAQHGGTLLPSVELVSYNVELKDNGGFIGDRASKGAFRDFIETWRKPMREMGHDPFGDESSVKIAKKRLEALLTDGDTEAAGVIQSAIESFAQELAIVMRRFLRLKEWTPRARGCERSS